ncbi:MULTISPECIES: hemerythrin domain-containing protein [unclassified Clostridium]|uniref:hemerythrin domain-containing protein n=1 Tax=unclassified Clostridium TaxID=2614128 RepID=UPI0013F029E5|nr:MULTISPECIES: hemerythrin domain-containing protein [unclassified Clostridium]NFG63416.1 hemerythrin domain-containing protein [Clostridium botulinum]NFQ11098.1 hemerythrin domain-containing protein [Clostridium botulinum]
MDLKNFKRQHIEICDIIKKIEEIIIKDDISDYFDELASNINKLSGKLQIHLNTEDKFLYPNLLKDDNVKHIAQKYVDEMGGILIQFISYKDKFNTKIKLKENKNHIVSETNSILLKITRRMNKEENELYKLI